MPKLLLFCLFFMASGALFAQEKAERLAASEPLELGKNIRLYPSPATEYLHIQLDAPIIRQVKFTIHNILGSIIEVESEFLEDDEVRLKVKDLPSGYYLLSVKSEEHGRKGTFKFLKR